MYASTCVSTSIVVFLPLLHMCSVVNHSIMLAETEPR